MTKPDPPAGVGVEEVAALAHLRQSLAEEVARRTEAEQVLLQTKDQFQAMLDAVPGAVSWISSDLKYIGINAYLASLYNMQPDDFVGQEIGFITGSPWFSNFVREFFSSPDQGTFREIQAPSPEGSKTHLIMAQKYHHGQAAVFVGIDISERKAAEEKLRQLALYDSLTHLPNRSLFMSRLERAFEHARRHPEYQLAVLFLDFDHFKNINDSLGHVVGDQLLTAIARRLETHLRATDTVARLGGDEFTFLLEDIKDISDATRVAERIQEEMTTSFLLDSQEVYTNVTIGIAFYTPNYERAEDMLRDADIAMYRAKAMGRGRYAIFDQHMHAEVVRRLQLETDLRRALENRELLLHYQPIVSLRDGTLYAFECLLRWPQAAPSMVAPGEFIPLAEDTGLIIPIDFWVLREACRQFRQWREMGQALALQAMSVNISAKQFTHSRLVGLVEETLRENELQPENLKLEITEGVFMGNNEAATQVLQGLRQLGVHLSMDDFGTGYSSLSYLHRYPLDTLKIDRSFITRVGAGGEDLEIVRAIVTLAKNLRMEVVAEGVETVDQLNHLLGLDCEFGQGYYFARPLSVDKALELLNRPAFWWRNNGDASAAPHAATIGDSAASGDNAAEI